MKTADVVIVGAGVTGCSIAMQLAMRKAGRILILEKSEVGFGGSGRSSALVRMHYSFPGEVQLAVKSLEIFRHWPEIVGRPGDFRPTGFVRLVPGNEVERLRLNVTRGHSREDLDRALDLLDRYGKHYHVQSGEALSEAAGLAP